MLALSSFAFLCGLLDTFSFVAGEINKKNLFLTSFFTKRILPHYTTTVYALDSMVVCVNIILAVRKLTFKAKQEQQNFSNKGEKIFVSNELFGLKFHFCLCLCCTFSLIFQGETHLTSPPNIEMTNNLSLLVGA